MWRHMKCLYTSLIIQSLLQPVLGYLLGIHAGGEEAEGLAALPADG